MFAVPMTVQLLRKLYKMRTYVYNLLGQERVEVGYISSSPTTKHMLLLDLFVRNKDVFLLHITHVYFSKPKNAG